MPPSKTQNYFEKRDNIKNKIKIKKISSCGLQQAALLASLILFQIINPFILFIYIFLFSIKSP